jgi:hypothetical protein
VLASVLLTALALSGPLHSFTKFSGEAFSLGVGARALGMGSAFVSQVGGTASLYWNPAGLSWDGRREILAMHSERFGGEVDYDFLGYSQPLRTSGGGAAIGFGLIRLGVSDIIRTAVANPDEDPSAENQPFPVESLGTAQYQIMFGYATELKRRYRVGGTVKDVHKSLEDESGTGFGFDLGALIPIGEGDPMTLGVVLQDIPTTFVAFTSGTKETTAPTLRTGLSLNDGIDVPGGDVVVAAATSVRFTNRGPDEGEEGADQIGLGPVSMNLHLGGEYRIGQQLALRGGLDEGTPTAGGGIALGNFAVDYAWFGSPGEGLENTHRISAGFFF